MPAFVLDSFALLAYLQDEPGAGRVQEILEPAVSGDNQVYMSVVTLGEVMYTIERRRGLEPAQEALAFVDQAPIRLLDADRTVALAAARLKAATGIGYADCFVAATAQLLDAAVVSGDPDFEALEGDVAMEWVAR